MTKINYTLISLLGLLALFMSSCESSQKITEYRGKVKYETISVSSKLPGRISKIFVQESQEVKKGDTLALIDIPEVSAKITQTEGAIRAAQGQLDMATNGATEDQLKQIEGKLGAAQAQLDYAIESYNRMEAMLKDSLITQQQFDEVKMKRNMAEAQISALKAMKNEAKNSARIEQINQAKGQLARALGAREEVNTAAREKYILAPSDMSIETISLNEGELLTPGYTLFNGYKKSDMFFRFTVPESKIYNFKVGQELTLINPYTKDEIAAKVLTIKQLAKYANITSTAPMYDLSEAIYELKVIPTESNEGITFYRNATILIKE